MKFSLVSGSAALCVALACASALPARAETAPGAAEKGAPAPADVVGSLSSAELDEILSLLKSNYIQPDALSELALKRATIQGLLARLSPGAALLSATAAGPAVASPFRSENLPGKIAYLRLGSTTPANVAELDAALQKLPALAPAAVVLDLRATPAGSEFEQMAEVCRRFVPKGRIMFSVRKAGLRQEQVLTARDEPKYRGVLVALVSAESAGSAEVIAAVLREQANALVIGQQTRGEAAEFAEFPIGSGKLLRLAVAEVALPGKSSVFPSGVKPDVTVDVPPATTEAVLKEGVQKGVAALVFENERPRMNEAALVSGANPELDAAEAAQNSKTEHAKTPLHDAVLQRAVDFVVTLALYDRRGKPAK